MHEAAHFPRRKKHAIRHAFDTKESVAGAMRADRSFDDVAWMNCECVGRVSAAAATTPSGSIARRTFRLGGHLLIPASTTRACGPRSRVPHSPANGPRVFRFAAATRLGRGLTFTAVTPADISPAA